MLKQKSIFGKCRNTNIEVLRLILMLAIFVGHVVYHGYNFPEMCRNRYTGVPGYYILIFINLLCTPAVDCFMFISGYYGIKFSLKKFLSLVAVMFILVTCITIAVSFGQKKISIGTPINVLLRWSFMHYYLMVYLLAPVLNKGIEALNKSQFNVLLILLFCFNVYSFICDGGYDVETFILLYFIGKYCSRYSIGLTLRKSAYLFNAFLLGIFGLELFCSVFSDAPIELRLLSYKDPAIIVMAICLFFVFYNIKPRYNRWLNKYLASCLFIYLITEGMAVSVPLYGYIRSFIEQGRYIQGIILSIGIILFCLVFGFVIKKVVDKFMGKISFSLNYLQ